VYIIEANNETFAFDRSSSSGFLMSCLQSRKQARNDDLETVFDMATSCRSMPLRISNVVYIGEATNEIVRRITLIVPDWNDAELIPEGIERAASPPAPD
jgi:hypothetical protein